MLPQVAQRSDSGGHRQRIAAQRASLVDRSKRRQKIHEALLSAEDANRQTSANDFAQSHKVGVHAIEFQRSAQSDAEAGHHLIGNHQRTLALGERAQASQVPSGGRNAAGIADDWLQNHCGNRARMSSESCFHSFEFVVGKRQRKAGNLLRHAGRAGNPEGGYARAGLDQQSVSVAVVTTLELDDDFAPGGGTGQSNRGHRRLGSGADKAQLLDGRIAGDDVLGEIGLGGG